MSSYGMRGKNAIKVPSVIPEGTPGYVHVANPKPAPYNSIPITNVTIPNRKLENPALPIVPSQEGIFNTLYKLNPFSKSKGGRRRKSKTHRRRSHKRKTHRRRH